MRGNALLHSVQLEVRYMPFLTFAHTFSHVHALCICQVKKQKATFLTQRHSDLGFCAG